jgi:hypothetical protein
VATTIDLGTSAPADASLTLLEIEMSELETKNEAETEAEDFTDELSDEALDREGGNDRFCGANSGRPCRQS